MKIPLIWLQDYVKTDKSPREIAAAFTQLGLMLDKPLDNSGVLDLEHRMDRSDWLSVTGCARDLAAYEGIPFHAPPLYNKAGKKISSADAVKITVKTPHVRRFNTVVIKGVKVKPSPTWLAQRLQAYGIDPVNNIVDITNFCMVELGQPMHAQDLAKLKQPEITLRQAEKGEELLTLLGTTIKLDQETFVLSSGGVPTVIGGIVGGQRTGITSTTKDIILDAGNYDQRVVRKTSRRLKIINETVSRYDKFLDPRACEYAIKRAVGLILQVAGGEYFLNQDYYPSPVTPQNLTLRFSRLELLSGMKIPESQIIKTLQALDYAIVEQDSQSLTVEIPYFRTDVEVEDDLIADILRLGDYSNIPTIPLSCPVPVDITPPLYQFEDLLRDILISLGSHEHITNSLVKSTNSPAEVKLANALSSDQNALRFSLIPSLSAVREYYAKHGQDQISLFEISKVFRVVNKNPQEQRRLTFLGTNAKHILRTLLHRLGIKDFNLSKSGEIMQKNKIIGEYTSTNFTLYIDELHPLYRPYQGIISEFTHSTSLDISLVVPAKLKYADLHSVINQLQTTWSQLDVSEPTPLSPSFNNYLLTITWDSKSPAVHKDKVGLLKALRKIGVTSKS